MTRESGKAKRRQHEYLDAAASVFADKGYHGATTGDIAARLGIKQGSLYYYFRSKEEALEQVCLMGVQGFVQTIEDIAASNASLREKIGQAVAAHLGALATRKDYVVVFLDQRRHLPPDRRGEILVQSRRYVQVIEDILKAAREAQEIQNNTDPRLAALNLVGLCNSVADWYGHDPNLTIELIGKNITNMFIDGVGA
jgi:TetR/AcrR family transcriptional regulator, cholesterol catabolism regulator